MDKDLSTHIDTVPTSGKKIGEIPFTGRELQIRHYVLRRWRPQEAEGSGQGRNESSPSRRSAHTEQLHGSLEL